LSRSITLPIVSAISSKADTWVPQAQESAATMDAARECHVGPLPGPSVLSSFRQVVHPGDDRIRRYDETPSASENSSRAMVVFASGTFCARINSVKQV
jgi:hypothetical protein